MSKNKSQLLSLTIEITKEYVRGGGSIDIPTFLERTFNKLIELNEKTKE